MSDGSTPTIAGSPGQNPFGDDIGGVMDLDLEEKALATAVLETKRLWDADRGAVNSGEYPPFAFHLYVFSNY